MKLYSTTDTLKPQPPFDFDKSLGFIKGFAPAQNEQTVSERVLAKAMMVDGQIVVIRCEAKGTIEKPELACTLFSNRRIGASVRAAALDRCVFFLSLSDDLKPFYAIGRRDPKFAPVVQQLYGLHQAKFLTPFESACWGILSQRISIPVARKIKQALVQEFGGSLQLDGTRYGAFPEPVCVLQAGEPDLRAVVKNDRKVEYLLAAASAFAQADEAFLRTGDYAQVRDWLLAIKGIGEWTADLVLVRGLGRMEQLHLIPESISEKRTCDAAGRVYANGKTLSRREFMQLADGYGAWQGYWSYYLRTLAG